MIKYDTFKSLIDILLNSYKKTLEFESGLEKLLGQDSTIICNWMTEGPRDMLKTLVLNETSETEDGWNWFEEHIDDFASGRGSKIAIKDNDVWKEYSIKSFDDYYLYLIGKLKHSRIYTDNDVESYEVRSIRFGPNGVEII